MRKLASIRKVRELRPIEGADLIELAIVDGWQCVIKKGEFKPGDLGVYFEIDSFLPLREEFEFLRKSCYKKMGEEEGLRLKTVKLRGELSQGLIIPITILNSFPDVSNEVYVGMDVTDALGVKKYDPPIPAQLAGSMAGNFPSFIRKTDQERIQNLFYKYSSEFSDNNLEIAAQLDPELYADRIKELTENRTVNPIKDMDFEVSLKLDGTSCTYFVCDSTKFQTKSIKDNPIDGNELFSVCGRNFEIKENEDNTYWKVALRDGIREKMIKFLRDTGRSIAIQGELMGPGIQGNREKLNEHKFFLFDVWDIDEQRYLTASERELIVDILGVNMVPIINPSMKVFQEFSTLDEILNFAEGPSITHSIREGLVFKSNSLIKGEPISFKSISNKFLLKGGE